MPNYIEWTGEERRQLAAAVADIRTRQPDLSGIKVVKLAMQQALGADRQRNIASTMQLFPWLDKLLEEIGGEPICNGRTASAKPEPAVAQTIPKSHVRPVLAPPPVPVQITRTQPERDGRIDQVIDLLDGLARSQGQIRQDIQANHKALTSGIAGLHASVSRLVGEVHLLNRHLRGQAEPTDRLPTVLVVGSSDQHQQEVISQACKQRATVRFMDLDHTEDDPVDDWIVGTQWTPKRWWDTAKVQLDPTAMVFVPGDTQDIVNQIFELVGG